MTPTYSVAERWVIAETTDLRVVEFTLAEGEAVPWHHHSAIADTAYCLEGLLSVETRNPDNVRMLTPGQSAAIPPGQVHRNRNGGKGLCRFLLVQGCGIYDFVKEE